MPVTGYETWEDRTPSGEFKFSSSVLLTHPFEDLTRILLTIGKHIYVSDDLGHNWRVFDPGINDTLGVLVKSDDGTFYVSTQESGVAKGRIEFLAN